MPSGQKHILVVPMDWGLGHATRCVPVIRALLQRGHKVSLGLSGEAGAWLQAEFPHLPGFVFPSYNMVYSARLPMAMQMLRKAPSILRTIDEENKVLDQLHQREKFDMVISDNRYGVHHPEMTSVLITHQLQVNGGGMKFMEPLLLRAVLSYMSRFDVCWVPDLPGDENLGGALSHIASPPEHLRYIGPMSRYNGAAALSQNVVYDLAIVLSGPEPHRSQWEDRLLDELEQLQIRVALVRGTTLPLHRNIPASITMADRANSSALLALVQQSAVVLSRSGYSSVMDWVALGKPAILVPTPGQTEQEYLAAYLRSKGYFYSTDREDELRLEEALRLSRTYQPPALTGEGLLAAALDALA